MYILFIYKQNCPMKISYITGEKLFKAFTIFIYLFEVKQVRPSVGWLVRQSVGLSAIMSLMGGKFHLHAPIGALVHLLFDAELPVPLRPFVHNSITHSRIVLYAAVFDLVHIHIIVIK